MGTSYGLWVRTGPGACGAYAGQNGLVAWRDSVVGFETVEEAEALAAQRGWVLDTSAQPGKVTAYVVDLCNAAGRRRVTLHDEGGEEIAAGLVDEVLADNQHDPEVADALEAAARDGSSWMGGGAAPLTEMRVA